MKVGTKLRNIHSDTIATITKVEVEVHNGKATKFYTLFKGDRWAEKRIWTEEDIEKHFVVVDEG